MSDRPDLIVVGDVMVDVSVEAAALATEGDVHGEVRIHPGGAGANAAAWAACQDVHVHLYGRVGDDLPGRLLREAVERAAAPIVAVDGASWPLLEAFGAGRFLEAVTKANLLLVNDREAEVLTREGGTARGPF